MVRGRDANRALTGCGLDAQPEGVDLDRDRFGCERTRDDRADAIAANQDWRAGILFTPQLQQAQKPDLLGSTRHTCIPGPYAQLSRGAAGAARSA